jgi:Kdo2-lipid IVA lauroyltransferase/acyltransferase
MARPRNRVNDFAVYLVIRIAVCAIQALSLAKAQAFARFLAWIAYHVDRRHRDVARENLRHAFSAASDVAIDRHVRAVYEHFCTVLIEIVQIPRRFHVNVAGRYMEMIHGERILGALTGDRPTLIVTGHFGNWEMSGYMIGMFGFRTYAVARRLDNPYLDKFFASFRSGTGQTILDKSTDYDRIQQVLRGGGAIAMLADQDAGPRGMFVDFFGRPASTFKSIALLALEYNAVLVVVGVPKVGEPMRYEIVTEDVILPEEYADQPDAVKAMTQRFTSALERLVRRAPEQYFWLHRRWKNQPPIRKAKAA